MIRVRLIPRSHSLPEQIRRWRRNRMAFRREAILLEDGRPFGEVMEKWQADDFKALDSGQYRHAYLERPRGHSKTGDIGTEAVTELMLGSPNQRLYCCAADEDQARLLFEDVQTKFQRNPLLANCVEVLKKEIRVKATGSCLRILNSDAPSSWGLRPDWIAIDELATWAKRELWDSLWSASGKRPRCRMLVISTAGWDKASIAWEVRQIAEAESDWYFAARGSCARWIRKDWLEQQRRTLPSHVFARLHEARWVDGVGAFLTAEEVDAIFTNIPQGTGPGAIGLDIGLSRDRTVAAVVRNISGVMTVQHLLTWAGKPGRKVALEDVEQEVKLLAERHSAAVHYDPYQGVLLGQRLQKQGILMKEYSFTSESRRKLFSTLLDLIRTRRLRAPLHAELRRELLNLEVTETSAGWRVDHRPGRHDDHVIAVALGAQAVAGQRYEGDFATDAEITGQMATSSDPRSPWAEETFAKEFWSDRGVHVDDEEPGSNF